MRDLVAGIDSSTQSCTVVLRRLSDGAVMAEARTPHPPVMPPVSEQDPEAWWQALLAAFARLSAFLPRIAALSVGGQGHGLVLLDADDRPLRKAKLWNDTEPAPDALTLCDRLAAGAWATRTGSVPGPALTVSKLAWTERCHPGLVAQARHVLLPADYIVYRLCRRAVTERGGGSGTGYLNPFENRWEPDLADLAVPGIDWASRLPTIIASDARAGTVQPAPGLEDLVGAVVGAGSGDNMTAALGLAIRPGDTVISVGTSGTIYGVTTIPVCDETGAINGYADASGNFLPMVTTLNAAKVTDTFRALMGIDVEAFDRLALAADAGAHGLVLVPYLDGERTPNRPDASGTLVGLRTGSTRADLARATVESVLCGLLEGGDLLAAAAVPMDGRLILTGGASRSLAYRQVLADLTGRPVWCCPMVETAAGGAAVQAAAAMTGRPVGDLATAWAPTLDLVAEPRQGEAGPSVRAAYRQAAAETTAQGQGHLR
ncbi:MAG TPA: FGGY family carbohydrate kinase [Stellaceae bacterium]|nr:FGGY family carbohydrate kinase [Stellaceae bacterium]